MTLSRFLLYGAVAALILVALILLVSTFQFQPPDRESTSNYSTGAEGATPSVPVILEPSGNPFSPQSPGGQSKVSVE